MGEVTVWSERDEPNAAGWRDCTYSAGLTALVYGGKRDYPLGLYTTAEREALERSDDHVPDESGGSQADLTVAVARRYGLTLRRVPWDLPTALNTPGICLTIAGSNGRFAQSDPWRRWDPPFAGPHCVAVIPQGDGTSRVLDPEAPWGYAGDIVPNSKVLQWAYGDNENMRMVLDGEFASAPTAGGDMPTIVENITGYTATIAGPSDANLANIRSAPRISPDTLIAGRHPGPSNPEKWVVVGWVVGDTDADTGSNRWLCWVNSGAWEYTAEGNVPILTPPGSGTVEVPVEVPVPPSEDACKAFSEAAYARGKDDGVKWGTDVERERVIMVLGLTPTP